jgi:hypothetical protein
LARAVKARLQQLISPKLYRLAAQKAPEFATVAPSKKQRAQGMPDAQQAPAASRAKQKSTRA